MDSIEPRVTFASLPTEIRLEILSYVFNQEDRTGFRMYSSALLPPTGLYIDDTYSSAARLQVLLTCRQFGNDFTTLAFRNTHFIVRDTFRPVRSQLDILTSYHISALRNLSFVVVGQTQFRDMMHWSKYPFDLNGLRLDTLAVIFHRSGHLHYPHDFTHSLVALLRRLQNVQKLKFIRNGANIKGFFKTWFNRLVGLILKEDHHQRYDFPGAPHLPACWWDWSFDDAEQSFELVAREPMGVVEETAYMEIVKPWIEKLMSDMEQEEVDPDPRARNGW
jgi:hypothetical protein